MKIKISKLAGLFQALAIATIFHIGGLAWAESPKSDASALTFPGETVDQWHGFVRHKFKVDGCEAWVVEPKTALPGKPWSWCMEFSTVFSAPRRHFPFHKQKNMTSVAK